MSHPTPDKKKEGQESVWEYPRPPAIRSDNKRVEIWFGGEKIIDSTGTYWQILETSHPPTYYFPIELFEPWLRDSENSRSTFCEWKGTAKYHDVVSKDGKKVVERAAFSYPSPSSKYGGIKNHVSSYANAFDRILIDGEEIVPQQEGEVGSVFYAGWWRPSKEAGPIKGRAKNSMWW